jgi:hypothetical protein
MEKPSDAQFVENHMSFSHIMLEINQLAQNVVEKQGVS